MVACSVHSTIRWVCESKGPPAFLSNNSRPLLPPPACCVQQAACRRLSVLLSYYLMATSITHNKSVMQGLPLPLPLSQHVPLCLMGWLLALFCAGLGTEAISIIEALISTREMAAEGEEVCRSHKPAGVLSACQHTAVLSVEVEVLTASAPQSAMRNVATNFGTKGCILLTAYTVDKRHTAAAAPLSLHAS